MYTVMSNRGLAHRYDSGSRKREEEGEGSARVNDEGGREERPSVENPFYTSRGYRQSRRRACPFQQRRQQPQRRQRRGRQTTSCARIPRLSYPSGGGEGPRGGDRQRDRELVEEARSDGTERPRHRRGNLARRSPKGRGGEREGRGEREVV